MKNFTIATLAAAFLLTTAGLAQDRPEPVPDFAKIQRPQEWYGAQMKLWKEEIGRNGSNAEAWLNYYKAARYYGFSDTSGDEVKAERMKGLIEEMGRAVPNSFEYHYVRWWDGGNRADLFPELQKAYEIRPDYRLLSDDFVTYYEMHGDAEKMRFFCRKWYETREISPALLEYNYNVLMSLEKNAILVTVGDNDTYPLWVLQAARNIRPDVTVMNTSLISEPEYRGRMLKEHGIQCDYARLSADSASGSYEIWITRFLKNIAESNTKRPVYFGLTVDPMYVDLVKENLYTVGLANRYSPKRIDNVALLKKNWENFHLDYLDHGFYNENYIIEEGAMPRLNMNYIPPMMILFEHYLLSGESSSAEKFRKLALQIGRDGDQEKDVRDYIDMLTKQDEPSREDDPNGRSASVDERESALGREVSIFPNPAYSTLTVTLPEALDADLQLADMQGHILRTMKGSGREIRIDIGGIAAGTYLVNIRTAKGSASKKVQVVR